MKLKTSLFSWMIIKNDLYRNLWLSLLYFFMLFILVPLRIINYANDNFPNYNKNYNMERILGIFDFRWGEFQKLLMILFPIILSVFVFLDIQRKHSNDHLGFLPVKREKVFWSKVIVALICILLPIFSIMLTSMIIITSFNLNIPLIYLVKWALITILMEIVIFSIGCLAASISGNPIIHAIVALGFSCLVSFMFFFINQNLKYLIYGYYFLDNNLYTVLSPAIWILDRGLKDLTSTETIEYILMAICLIVLSQFLFKIRKAEKVGDVLVFEPLKLVFKYTLTLLAMLFMGLIFNDSKFYIFQSYHLIAGYIIGAVVGYVIAEMILNKTFLIKLNDLKGLVYYLLVVAVFVSLIRKDALGIERKVPDISNIKSVYFGSRIYEYEETKNKSFFESSKEEYVDRVAKLHKEIITDRKIRNINGVTAYFVYNLKNGKSIYREYTIDYDYYKEYLKPVYESYEYKKTNIDLLMVDLDDVSSVCIYGPGALSKEVQLLQKQDIKEALENLKKDCYDEKYESMIDYYYGSWGEIFIKIKKESSNKYPSGFYNRDGVWIKFKKNYVNFEKWLDKKGLLKNVRVMPEDVDYIAIIDAKGKIKDNIKDKEKIVDNIKSYLDSKDVKRIYDKKEIEKILRTSMDFYATDNTKLIVVVSKTGSIIEYGSLREEK